MYSIPCAAFVAIALSVAARVSAAQHPVREVPHAVVCPGCQLEFTEVLRIGGPTSAIQLTPRAGGVVRDSKGRYWIATEDRSEVAVFDSAGRHIRSFGGKGGGPGEIDAIGINFLRLGIGDTVFVFHGRNSVNVVAPSFDFVRRIQIPSGVVHSAQVLNSGELVINSSIPTRERVGLPFHLVGPTGSVVRSFGEGTAGGASSSAAPNISFVLARDGMSLWHVMADFRLRQVPVSGAAARGYDIRNVPWFRQPVYEEFTGLGGRMQRRAVLSTNVSLAGIDTDGNLWLNAVVRENGVLSYRVEVIDLSTGGILISRPSPIGGMFLLDRWPMAVTATADADGANITYTFWRYRIVR